MPQAIVEALGLTKNYGQLQAVAGINFQVNAGECFGLLGPNGAGKSTTFRMLCCVSPLSGGSLIIDGMDVTKDARAIKSILGVVPQENNLDPDLSVLQNLLVYARYFDLPRDVALQRAEESLDLFQLAERKRDRVDTLSGGMKRRLLIARALLNAPKIIIMDEPTTGLDPQARHLIWRQLRTLQAAGVTILLSTHYMEEAAQLCHRVAILYQGRILAEGRPRDLVAELVGQEVIEGVGEDEAREEAAGRFAGVNVATQVVGDKVYVFNDGSARERLAGLPVQVVQRPATLEDVFLRLTGTELSG